MNGRDFLDGDFQFETELTQVPKGWTASAMGYSATHADQSQALNDLNLALNSAMEKGELTPNSGF